jgi:hypothetical protein
MRFIPLLALAAMAGVLPLGCLSGQTGSPDCPAPASCVCSGMDSTSLLRVHIESASERQLVAVVDEVLAGLAIPDASPVAVGDRVGGFVVLERRSCDHYDVMRPLPAAGSELFVAHSVGYVEGFPYCSERETCNVEQCGFLSEPERMPCLERCATDTQPICDEYRKAALLGGSFVHALPYSDPLDFGGGKRVALSELALLRDPGTCTQRFPIVQPPPCDDVQSSCSIGPAARRTSASFYWLAWLGALVACAIARRSKPGRH